MRRLVVKPAGLWVPARFVRRGPLTRFYFDASGISNARTRPADREVLVRAFARPENRLLVSEVNVREIVATTDAEAREDLLALTERLSPDLNILVSPGELLRRTLAARQQGADEFVSTMSTPVRGVRDLLRAFGDNAAVLLDDARRHNRELDDRIYQADIRSRDSFQQIRALDKARGANGARFARFILSGEDPSGFIRSWIRSAAQPGAPDLTVAQVLEMPVWRSFLLSFCLHTFDRGMRVERYGKRTRAEPNDMLQSIYLPLVDVYVVHDRNHYRHARRVARLMQAAWKKPVARILHYDAFVTVLRRRYDPLKQPRLGV